MESVSFRSIHLRISDALVVPIFQRGVLRSPDELRRLQFFPAIRVFSFWIDS